MIKAEYIESGTFVTGEEEVFHQGISPEDEVIILTKQEFHSLLMTIQESHVGFSQIYDSLQNYCTDSAMVTAGVLAAKTNEVIEKYEKD